MTRLKSEIRLGSFGKPAIQQRARLLAEWNRHPDGHSIFDGKFEQFVTIMRPRRPPWKKHETQHQ